MAIIKKVKPKVRISMGITPGVFGQGKRKMRPSKFYQVQMGSKLKNVKTRKQATELAKKWKGKVVKNSYSTAKQQEDMFGY